MKHLKKILVALLLVAMITSSVIVIALADDYTGTVAGAEELYENYENASGEDAKADALASLYLYLTTSPIDPSSAGYDELIDNYNSAVVKVAYCYHGICLYNTHTTDERAAMMAEIYLAYAASPLYKVTDHSVPLAYYCDNEAHETPTVVHFASADEFYAGIPASATCPDGCGEEDQNLVGTELVRFSDVYKDIQKLNVDITGLVVNKLYEQVADAAKSNYFDLAAAKDALAVFLESYPVLSVTIPDALVYTGDLTAVEAKMSALATSDSLEQVRDGLAWVYDYLIKNPVSPANEKYSSFYAMYDQLCGKLMSLFEKKVVEATAVEEKIAIFNEMHTFLAGVEDDPATTEDETVAPKFISENVVGAYNALRTRVIGEYETIIAGIAGETEFDQAIPGIEYNVSDLTDLRDKLDKALTQINKDKPNMTLVKLRSKPVFQYLLDPATNKIDPTAATYESIMADYAKVCNFFTTYYTNQIVSSLNFIDKYSNLQSFREYLAEFPYSSSGIAAYNNMRAEFLNAQQSFYNAMSEGIALPSYTSYSSVSTTIKVETLNSLVSDIEDSYIAYNAAETEDKPAALENWKNAASALSSVLNVVSIKPDETFVASFSAGYAASCAALTETLLLAVDAESDAALKASALADVKSYITANGFTSNAIKIYNAKVAEVFAGDSDKIAEEEIDSAFFVAADAAARVEEASDNIANSVENAYEEFFAAAKTLQDAYDIIYNENNVLDPAYEQIMTAYDNASVVINSIVSTDVTNAIADTDATVTFSTLTMYSDFLRTVNYKDAITTFNSSIDTALIDVEITLNLLLEDAPETAYIVSAFEAAQNKIDAYNVAVSYEDKLAAFKDVYAAMDALQATIYSTDAPYADLVMEFETVKESFVPLIIATLNGNATIDAEFNALVAVKQFITNYNFSTLISAAYNEKLNALKSSSPADLVDMIANGTLVITYASPENTLSDFSGFQPIISGSSVDVAELTNYFNKLSGKETGIKAIDVFSIDFASIISEYKVAFDLYLSNLDVAYDAITGSDASNAEQLVDITNLLADVKSDFETLSATKAISALYNEMVADATAKHHVAIKETAAKYAVLTQEVHDYIESCPVNETALDLETRAKYNNVKTKLEAAEYEEVDAYIDEYNSVTGSNLIMDKEAVNKKVTKYITQYGLDSNISNKKIADALLVTMFETLINEFDESIQALDPSQQAVAIGEFADLLESQSAPQSVVDIFKVKYPTADITAAAPAPTANEAAFVDIAAFVESFSASADLDDKKAAFTDILSYLSQNAFSNVSLYDSMMNAIDEMNEDLKATLDIRKELAQKNANLSDYNLGYQMLYDMENGKPYTTSFANKGATTLNVVSDGSNKYAEIVSASSSSYFSMNGFDSSSSFVIEFDLMLSENGGFWIESASDALEVAGARAWGSFIKIENGRLTYAHDYVSGNVDEEFSNYRAGVNAPIVFEPGKWTNIAIVVNPDTFITEMFIDYVSLGTKKLITGSGSAIYTCKFTELRFAANSGTTYCYDNLKVYTGSSYRDPDRFKGKSDAEMFEFYVDYAMDDTNSTTNRITAYYSATALIDQATSQEHKDKLALISVEEILDSAQEVYKADLERLIEPIVSEPITSANYAAKESAIASINSYIEKNQTYMDQASDWFAEANYAIIEAQNQIEWVKNLAEYAKVLPLFQRAPTLTALKRYAATANKYYQLCMLDDPAYLAQANSDDVIKSVITELRTNEDVEQILISDISVYHNDYMTKRLREQTYTENALLLINCVDAIELLVTDKTGLTTEQYHELLLKTAGENVDYVNDYIVAMRNVVVSGEYDENYPGVQETLVIYDLLDAMFYEIVQEEHYKLLEDQIARYKATNSYIERAGICTYIENYIVANNVDINSQRGALISYTVSVYKSELVTYRVEYEAILAENTNSFIALVENMQAYTEYSDLKPLYQTAIDNYYYNMNVDSDEAKAAIAIFSAYEKMIQDWELNSKLFLDYSENLKNARRPAQIYRALVNCAKYVDGADEGVDGVSDALKIYNEKLTAYNETINSTNSEISASIDIVCSVRTNVIASTVLAIIKSIFTK